MPIYEYACVSCGERFEQLVLRRSDEATVSCPACGKGEPSRVMSRPAAAKTGGSERTAPAARPCGPIG